VGGGDDGGGGGDDDDGGGENWYHRIEMRYAILPSGV
jgi:hypothetical protein